MGEAKPKVLVCQLTGIERHLWICPEQVMNLVAMARDTRFDVAFHQVKNAAPYEVALNMAVQNARHGNFDWLVSFDSDNFVLNGSPLDVLTQAGPQQDVIGLQYAVPSPVPHSSRAGFRLFPIIGFGAATDGHFIEAEYVGCGCIMVRNTVWQRIPKGPWFRWPTGSKDSETGEPAYAQDTDFCLTVRRRGLRVWTHRTLRAGHFKTTDITEAARTVDRLAGMLKQQRVAETGRS